MRKLFAIAAVVGALALVPSSGQEARAQGLHFGVGGLHIDVGRPHRGFYGYRSFHRGGWGHRGHYDWHDTSHYDFHPGGFQRHYNHYHYVPSHYDFHRQGHWDRHR